MKNLILGAAAFAIAIGFVACNRSKTVVKTFENNFSQNLTGVDSAAVSIRDTIQYLESFKGGEELCKKINNVIAEACYGEEYRGMTVEEANKAMVKELSGSYQKDAGDAYKVDKESREDGEENPYWLFNWYYLTIGKFGDKWGDFQTYDVYSESYTGGAHGMYSNVPSVISLKTGELVKEKDLFNPGFEGPVSGLIKESLKKAYNTQTDSTYSYQDMTEDGMVPNGMFAVSDKGMTWRYQPYEVACYAAGIIEATVAWKDLELYLKPEFAKSK